MADLVIKGHPTRGKEVIDLLETLGANRLGYKDTFVGFYYSVECGAIHSSDEYPTYSTIFTLEKFEEKYPYKVGDNVTHYIGRLLGTHVITNMRWDSDNNCVIYYLDNCDIIKVEDILYKIGCPEDNIPTIQDKTTVETMKEDIEKNQPPKTQADVDKYLQEHPIKNAMNVMDIEKCLEMDRLKLPENVVINSKGIGSIQFIQWYEKPQYPKTYVKCCDILKINPFSNEVSGYERNLISALQTLITCRNAYWKIIGEQMRLDGPWEPDWDNLSTKHEFIKINKGCFTYSSRVLVFPTEKIRDAFYENFKELIEQCKELL